MAEDMTPQDLETFQERYWAEHGMVAGKWAIHPGTGHVFFDGVLLAKLTIAEEETLLAIWRAFPMPYQAATMDRDLFKTHVARVRRKTSPWIVSSGPQRGYMLNPSAELDESR